MEKLASIKAWGMELYSSTDVFDDEEEDESENANKEFDTDEILLRLEEDEFYKGLPTSTEALRDILNENLARHDCLSGFKDEVLYYN